MTGAEPWVPVAITIFAWWFSTGIILLLVRLPRVWHGPMLLVCTIPALFAVWGLLASADNTTLAGVYCGFFCALMIWGWHEASFLTGIITGPRPKACPEGVRGLARFGYATATLIYHEIALFLTWLALVALSWNASNQIALMTFSLLFAMRLSAKFNIFLGVPNLTEEFFPLHLEHLKSYLPKRPMNALMPLSLLISGALAVWLWQQIAGARDDAGALATILIILSLTCLGILEHIFMITPLPDAVLWRWAVPVAAGTKTPELNVIGEKGREMKKPENA
jgi:putative photosynthetic complex assembly protein 2